MIIMLMMIKIIPVFCAIFRRSCSCWPAVICLCMQALPHLPGRGYCLVFYHLVGVELFSIHEKTRFLNEILLTWVFTPREEEALDLSRDHTVRKTNFDDFRRRQTGQEQPA
jgi:hypothetical protein